MGGLASAKGLLGSPLTEPEMTIALDVQTNEQVLPTHRDLFYGGAWHAPKSGRYVEIFSPSTGQSLGKAADAGAADADAAVEAARRGFMEWRAIEPLERSRRLRELAALLKKHAPELAMIDAIDGGSPVKLMLNDALRASEQIDYFAGLVTEMKGHSVPMGPNNLNFSIRQPLGVVARIIPFNHPYMFAIGKSAAPLAAGNSVIIKAAEQAPLSALRLAELAKDLLPPGVLNVLTGGREVGQALASHPGVAKVALIGSVETGKAVMRSAAETLKPILLELGGKNALIAYPDSDPDKVANAVVEGMNFTWCGQSCGSTSRAFIHADFYDVVIEKIRSRVAKVRPGLPTDPDTVMGAVISKSQHDKILGFIERAKQEGARLIAGGGEPADEALSNGYFIEPTIFADVQPDMTIAREEIFGPILSILRWKDEGEMLALVNGLPYGLTCSIFTQNITRAHKTALAVEAGYVWINQTTKHFLGTAFGGFKQSGLGREECLEELLSFTQEKSIHVNLA